MKGGLLVILWLIIFSILSYVFCKMLKLETPLLRTIFVWSFCMVFVAIFEMLLLFYYEYLEKLFSTIDFSNKNTVIFMEMISNVEDLIFVNKCVELVFETPLQAPATYCKIELFGPIAKPELLDVGVASPLGFHNSIPTPEETVPLFCHWLKILLLLPFKGAVNALQARFAGM